VSGTPSASPVTTPLKRYDSGVVTVAAGAALTCAAVADEVRCWGRNLPPAQRAIRGVTKLAVGVSHTCALVESTAEVTCWGNSGLGQDAGGVTLTGVTAIAAGSDHTCALFGGIGGAVKCWGSDQLGQLGDGAATGNFSVVPVTAIASGVRAIAASGDHTCAAAVSPSGTPTNAVRCWGDLPAAGFGVSAPPSPSPTIPLEDTEKAIVEFAVQELATGRTHVCVRKSGTTELLKCFGPDSANGELGGAPAAVTESVDVPGTAGTMGMAAGAEHTCAIFPGGSVRCWGSNAAGQLGDGTTATPGLAGDLRPLGTPVAVTGR
jgi:alpha-tubulin suppressor-like RCC1 family protein